MYELKDILVSTVAIICIFGLPLSIPIIYLVLNYRKRRRLIELVHAERLAAIERGMEIPTLPVEILGTPPVGRSALLSGLIWLLVGLALMAGLHGLDGDAGFGGLCVWGLVPTAVGVAYLIYYLVERRKPVHPREETT
jgi:hypothetical protein